MSAYTPTIQRTGPRLYVPYTQLNDATRAYLTSVLYTPVPVTLVDCNDAPWGYQDYLQMAWDKGETFLNMEHDIVPWPGAIHSLLDCPEPWCFFGYERDLDFVALNTPVFGLCRFRAEFIATMPDVWRVMRVSEQYAKVPWRGVDLHMAKYAKHLGYTPHQHWPAVFNASAIITDPLRAQFQPPMEHMTMSTHE